MSNEELDAVTGQLADVQRRLLDLPSDAFAERYALLQEHDVLRERASEFRQDWDNQRTDAELLAELAALRGRLEAIEKQKIDLVVQAGSGGRAAPGGDTGGVQINTGIVAAQGAGGIQARIGRIKGILEARGVEVPAK